MFEEIFNNIIMIFLGKSKYLHRMDQLCALGLIFKVGVSLSLYFQTMSYEYEEHFVGQRAILGQNNKNE